VKKRIFLIILNIFIFYLIVHSVRNILQIFNFNFWLTNIGHEQGVKISNFILKPLGLSYQRWTEGVFVIFEWLVIGFLLKLKKKTKLDSLIK